MVDGGGLAFRLIVPKIQTNLQTPRRFPDIWGVLLSVTINDDSKG
jgi:hypothetical protein